MVLCDNLKKILKTEKSPVSNAISSFLKFDNVREKKPSRLEHLNKNTLLHAVFSETQNALTKRNLAAKISRLSVREVL